MFDLGGDDKEKLKENMEEIKRLVESKDGGEASPPQPDTVSEEEPTPPAPQPEPSPDTGTASTHETVFDTSSEEFKRDLRSISEEVQSLDKSKEFHRKRSSSSHEGGTLFLEIDEFNHVKGMVEEMRYLSREVEDLMGQINNGIEDSRRLESEASEVLNEFSDRRDRIESSIN